MEEENEIGSNITHDHGTSRGFEGWKPYQELLPPQEEQDNIQSPGYSPEEVIKGCMDPEANNYNPDANQNEKCEYSVSLQRTIYDNKNLTDNVDNSFSELSVRDFLIKDFFNLYKKLFYNIPIKGLFSHQDIITRSRNYIGGYIHPRSKDINNLYTQITSALEILYSIEKTHSIIKNSSVLKTKEEPIEYYYIQTMRKRKINDITLIEKIKEINGYNPNQDISVPIDRTALDFLENGPDINTELDLGTTDLTINLDGIDIDSRTYLINEYGSGTGGGYPSEGKDEDGNNVSYINNRPYS